MPSAIVSSKGQITIPFQVRKRLGLVAGHRIHFVEMTSGQFALHVATVDIKSLRAWSAHHNPSGGHPYPR